MRPGEIVNIEVINPIALVHAWNSLQQSVWIGRTRAPHAGTQRCIRANDPWLAEEEYE
jgi:hypothetical protein